MNITFIPWETAFMPMNGSHKVFSQNSTIGEQISLLLMLIIALVGLAGNAIVLWLLGFRMRRNAFSVYILNLAGADFLLLCCQIALSVLKFMDYIYFIPFSIPSSFPMIFTFAYIAGLSFLSAISTERCLSVLWPIWYRCHRPRHMSAVMCALLWVLCLLMSILTGQSCDMVFKNFPFLIYELKGIMCEVFSVITTGWLIFLFVLLSACSLALVTRLLCGSQRAQLTRLYVTVMLTVLVFLLCGLPVGIFWSITFWLHYGTYKSLIPVFLVAHVLSCVNSCANPIIYFFVGSFRQRWKKRRQTLKLVLQRALQDVPEEDDHRGSLPKETLEMSGNHLVS